MAFSMMPGLLHGAALVGAIMAHSTPAAANLLSSLPWENLSSQLSPSAVLLDASTETYINECVSVFEEFGTDISQHDIHARGTSGLCMNTLVASYEQCTPVDVETQDEFLSTLNGFNREFFAGEVDGVFFDPVNPRFNLPYKVLQPKNAGDVVAAVKFAAEHGVEISVKNSGHNYNGASTKRDSILIHTPSLPKYSPSSLQDCTSVEEGAEILDVEIDDSLSNQPCKLALARKVPAAIRVGGGENFNDFYGSVRAMNEIALKKTGSFKYHPVGGAAATVTPMGWTWQGGLALTQNGRTHGFGVDQVLQIEMVLPDGSHVRFGPTDWEDADGYRFPKTTQVSGVCNENPSAEDESEWVWAPCTNDVDFNDLWHAVRGGLGGTWGVVLSVYWQLHEYPGPFQGFIFDGQMTSTLAGCNAMEAECKEFQFELVSVLAEFVFDFFLEPDLITDLSPEVTYQCGYFHHVACFGDVKDVIVSAWKTRLMEKKPNLIEGGVPEEMIKLAEGAIIFGDEAPDYLAFILFPEGHRHFGKASDDPAPAPVARLGQAAYNPLIPRSVVLENRPYWEGLIRDAFISTGFGPPLHFSLVDKTGDQMSSLSEPHRKAAFMAFDDPELNGLGSRQGLDVWFPMMFGGMDFNGDFPGVFGSNHITPTTLGPLKTDWTKPCPDEWSMERRTKECIPHLEAIYGTKALHRLQQIKADIDPSNMFNCFNCIQALESAEPVDVRSWHL